MLWFAVSFQDQVEKYGVYVGIAAFFGLAILSLLYFAQARELKRLREWAGRAPERARELEQRVVAQATATAARRPATAAGTGPMAPARRLAEMPAPAPAAPQATDVADPAEETAGNGASSNGTGEHPVAPGAVPAGEEQGAGDGATPDAGPESAGDGAAAPPADADPATVGPATAGPADTAAPAPDRPADADADADAPAAAEPEAPAGDRAAAVPAGAGQETVEHPIAPETDDHAPVPPAVPRLTPAQRVGVTSRPQPLPLRQSTPSATPSGGARRPAPPRRPAPAPAPARRSAGTVALLVGLAVLVLGGGAFALSQVLGGDDEKPGPNPSVPPASQTADPAEAATPNEETTVAVLNGTTVNGLAGQIADKVAAEGYLRGATGNNTADQSVQRTTVYYAEGFRAKARDVARLLSVSEVAALDAEIAGLAPDADVVVVAGADQAS